MALMEITIIPMGTGTTSCSPYIARVLDIAKADPAVTYQLNPMGTTLEGELSALYRCLQNMQEALFDDGIQRVYTIAKIDDRRDKYQNMTQRIQSVEEKQHD
ncbi:MAG: MTH1187 family thiamine-binding protein [Peptococcaceae bacterium]|nr:MTH1187 family thiamine-binding protein [Peptococcaceae bacterium]